MKTMSHRSEKKIVEMKTMRMNAEMKMKILRIHKKHDDEIMIIQRCQMDASEEPADVKTKP